MPRAVGTIAMYLTALFGGGALGMGLGLLSGLQMGPAYPVKCATMQVWGFMIGSGSLVFGLLLMAPAILAAAGVIQLSRQHGWLAAVLGFVVTVVAGVYWLLPTMR